MPKPKQTLLEPEMIPSENSRQRNLPISTKHIPWIILALVVIAAGVFAYQQSQSVKVAQQQLEELKKNPQQATEAETKTLLDNVAKLIDGLPAEQPTIATVTDLAPLKDQPFFANAQVGDKVLIYSQAKKAILYRPSTNKIVEIAPVDLDAPVANVNTNTTNSNTNKSTTNSNKNTNTANSNSGDE